LAEAAIQSGFGAYFMTAHDLVSDLGRAYREGRLDRRMRVYLAPRVLIIDEMGYLPLDELGATIFFQLVSARYERGSIILSSNKSYGDWGSIFGDPIIATAILDRLLHHSTTINIRGESYRLKDRRRAGLLPQPGQETALIVPPAGTSASATSKTRRLTAALGLRSGRRPGSNREKKPVSYESSQQPNVVYKQSWREKSRPASSENRGGGIFNRNSGEISSGIDKVACINHRRQADRACPKREDQHR
jgi:hypothetical protein